MKYIRSQTGWVPIGLFISIILILVLSYINQWGNNPISTIPFLIMMGLFMFVILLFYKLRIKVEGPTIKIVYGIGLIRIKLIIDKLFDVKIIKTHWYYGLGIRITPKGMLYNIQGSKAVRIKFESRGDVKTVMIGTAEPELLKKFLDEHLLMK